MSTGSSSPALATRTTLRERKDMAFTTPPYTGEGGREGGGGVKRDGERGQEKREGGIKGMERLIL